MPAALPRCCRRMRHARHKQQPPAEALVACMHIPAPCPAAHLLSHSRPLVTEVEAVWVPAATSSLTIWNTSAAYSAGLVAAQVASRSMLPPTSWRTRANPVPSLSAGEAVGGGSAGR